MKKIFLFLLFSFFMFLVVAYGKSTFEEGVDLIVQKHHQEALSKFQKACDEGLAKGCYNSGNIYYYAPGNVEPDLSGAFKYYKKCLKIVLIFSITIII